MLNFRYVGGWNKNVHGGLEGRRFRNWSKVGFDSTSTQIVSKWQNVTLIQKRGKYTYSNELINLDITILWFLREALRFEAAMLQLHTSHMDLYPPTHVQLQYPTIDVWDMLRLSIMLMFGSIENHLHIEINK